MIEDHWREFHGQGINTSDKAVAEKWLQQRLALPIQVVEFDDGQLTGARLCFLNDQMGAVIRYQVDGQSVSYYLMPDVASDNENQAVIN